MTTSKLYITDNQLSLVRIAFMSLTRDDAAFDYGIEQGVFQEDDIYKYVDTLSKFSSKHRGTGYLIHKATDINDVTNNATDLWGDPISKYII